MLDLRIDTVNLIIDGPPSEPMEGYTIYWMSNEESDLALSIPLYIDKHEGRLRKKYISFITDLGEQRHKSRSLKSYFRLKEDYNIWWMSLLVEKNLVKSPNISDCLKLFALEEILGNLTPSRMRLFTSNYRLYQVVKHLSIQLKIEWLGQFGTFDQSYRWKLKNIFPPVISGLVYILRNSIIHWPLRRLKKFNWHSNSEQVFIFSHFFNVHRVGEDKKEIYSKYWGVLPGVLKSKGLSINFLNTYLPSSDVPSTNAAVSWVTVLNHSSDKSRQKHLFYYSFLSLGLVFKVIIQFLLINLRGYSLGRIFKYFNPRKSKLNLWYVLEEDWIDSIKGTVLSENLMLIALIDKAVSELEPQKLGLYLQENNGWERALIHAWKRYQKTPIIGVPHTTIRYWDLRYFEDVRMFNCKNECLPRPDFVAVNGPVAKRMLEESGYSPGELVEVEALRYLEYQQVSNSVNSGLNKNFNHLRVLVCGDIDQNSTFQMLKCIEKAADVLRANRSDLKLEIVFKSHPANKIDLKKFYLPELTETNGELSDILTSFDLMIGADSTSASVEAYLKGLKVIVFIYTQRLNFSPLKGVRNVSFIYDFQDLLNVLTQESEVFSENKIEHFFWTDKSLPKWSNIFKNTGCTNFN